MQNNFGRHLRTLRESRGLTRESLAEASRLSVDIVARIERGRVTNPTRRTLEKLARGLDLNIAQLLGDEEEILSGLSEDQRTMVLALIRVLRAPSIARIPVSKRIAQGL